MWYSINDMDDGVLEFTKGNVVHQLKNCTLKWLNLLNI